MADNFDDDVDLILQLDDDRESLYELFASNPKHYLDLINNYNQLPSGHEIYLPDLVNLMQERTGKTKTCPGQLSIKFKLHDNDNWNVIGYTNDYECDYTDDLIYTNFSTRVELLIDISRKKPKPTQDKMAQDNMVKVSLQSLAELGLSKNNNIINRNVSKMRTFLIFIGRVAQPELLEIVNDPCHVSLKSNEMIQSLFGHAAVPICVKEDVEKVAGPESDVIVDTPVPNFTNDPSNPPSITKNSATTIIDAPIYTLADCEKFKACYLYHKKMAKGFKKIIAAHVNYNNVILENNSK